MLRANSKLRQRLGQAGIAFIEHAAGSILRLLPHVQVSQWTEGNWKNTQCAWTSPQRTEVRVTISVGQESDENARSLTATIKRRQASITGGMAKEVIDVREHDICRRIAHRSSQVLKTLPVDTDDSTSIGAISAAFDEFVVASHIQEHHDLELPVTYVLGALHTLAEQSYENKSLAFGCILNPHRRGQPLAATFPTDFLRSKKYKALSDGYHTAYIVSTEGRVLDFVDLDRFEHNPLTEKHYFPDWAEPLARASRSGRCGIALSRQGDLLVFDEGTLRFTYRYGRWQYWNHTHLVKLLRDRARAQRVPRAILGRVVGTIYRAALDVSFRRSGGLFVILHNRKSLRQVVRPGDALADTDRGEIDREFDDVIKNHKIHSLARAVTVELASLDGAVVLDNSGRILAYGAVLQPKKAGRLRGTEGSRTKAAIGASNYGLAVKISSDGDISVYFNGKEFICI